jgi:hypothetical protein
VCFGSATLMPTSSASGEGSVAIGARVRHMPGWRDKAVLSNLVGNAVDAMSLSDHFDRNPNLAGCFGQRLVSSQEPVLAITWTDPQGVNRARKDRRSFIAARSGGWVKRPCVFSSQGPPSSHPQCSFWRSISLYRISASSTPAAGRHSQREWAWRPR